MLWRLSLLHTKAHSLNYLRGVLGPANQPGTPCRRKKIEQWKNYFQQYYIPFGKALYNSWMSHCGNKMLNNGYDCNWKFWELITLLKVPGNSLRTIKATLVVIRYPNETYYPLWPTFQETHIDPILFLFSGETLRYITYFKKCYTILFVFIKYLTYSINIYCSTCLLCQVGLSTVLHFYYTCNISFNFIYYHNKHNSIFSTWQPMKLTWTLSALYIEAWILCCLPWKESQYSQVFLIPRSANLVIWISLELGHYNQGEETTREWH